MRSCYFIWGVCHGMQCYNEEVLPQCVSILMLNPDRKFSQRSVLEVLLTPDLSRDHHVTMVSEKCFLQLRQLRHIRRSLDDDSAATRVVYAFVASRVDYCGSLLIDAPPKKTTDKLQCTCPRRYSKSCIQQRQVRLRAESVVARQASLVVAIFNSVVVAYVNDRAKFRSQDPLDRFSQSLHHMVGTELQLINPAFFFRYLKERCHGSQFCGKLVAKLPAPSALITLSF